MKISCLTSTVADSTVAIHTCKCKLKHTKKKREQLKKKIIRAKGVAEISNPAKKPAFLSSLGLQLVMIPVAPPMTTLEVMKTDPCAHQKPY